MTTLTDIGKLKILNKIAKLYIEDDNDTFVDFSDYFNDGGANLLIAISSVRQSSEVNYGLFKV